MREYPDQPVATSEKSELSERWLTSVEKLTFAFQPIVHMHNGETYGFEALLRGCERAGFGSISEVFDTAEEEGELLALNRALQRKAQELFEALPLSRRTKLFFNVDNRVFDDDVAGIDQMLFPSLEKGPAKNHWFCVELSERHELKNDERFFERLKRFQERNITVAVDDFGSGFAGLMLLYKSNPDIIKIDRFFIADVHEDQTKKLFVTNLVHMAHSMGILVIAEGVESPQEFYTCRSVGCDLVQGFLIQKPQLNFGLLESSYQLVRRLAQDDRRRYRNTKERILRWMNYTEPMELDSPVITVLNRFRQSAGAYFFPVVNELGEPVGILREADMKNWVYSPFGISLLMNSSYKHEITSLISRVPVAAVETSLEAIVELYAVDPDAEAVLLTENGVYRGYLDSRTLVQLIHEQEIERARDENPLTRLPGNTVIREFVAERLSFDERSYLLAYLDFNNFKPFNDYYGFRHGDRVIQLLGDMLKEFAQRTGAFVGHVGGDDFFVAMELQGRSGQETESSLLLLQESFSANVIAFYDQQARDRGCIEAKDREGTPRRFPILTVSIGGAYVSGEAARNQGEEAIFKLLAEQKQKSKASAHHVAIRSDSVTIE